MDNASKLRNIIMPMAPKYNKSETPHLVFQTVVLSRGPGLIKGLPFCLWNSQFLRLLGWVVQSCGNQSPDLEVHRPFLGRMFLSLVLASSTTLLLGTSEVAGGEQKLFPAVVIAIIM